MENEEVRLRGPDGNNCAGVGFAQDISKREMSRGMLQSEVEQGGLILGTEQKRYRSGDKARDGHKSRGVTAVQPC